MQSPTLLAVAVPPTPTEPEVEPISICWLALGVITAIPNFPTILIVSPRTAVAGKV